jgi:hypothetical protein
MIADGQAGAFGGYGLQSVGGGIDLRARFRLAHERFSFGYSALCFAFTGLGLGFRWPREDNQ